MILQIALKRIQGDSNDDKLNAALADTITKFESMLNVIQLPSTPPADSPVTTSE